MSGFTSTPWPNLPLSKMTCSGKGPRAPRVHRRLSGHPRVSSGRHLRALPRDGSTAACSPSGERRTPTRGLAGGAAPLADWPPAASRSLSVSRKGMKWARVLGNRTTHHAILLLRESRIAIDLRWMVSEVLGSFRPRWSRKMKAQAFVALKFVR
jgi:hypothetical protein